MDEFDLLDVLGSLVDKSLLLVESGTSAVRYRMLESTRAYAGDVLGALVDRRTSVPHGSEIPFVFEQWPIGAVSDVDRRVGSALHDCWIAFARTGMPSCSAAPDWTPYDAHDGRLMVFDAHPSLREPNDRDVLDLLEARLLQP